MKRKTILLILVAATAALGLIATRTYVAAQPLSVAVGGYAVELTSDWTLIGFTPSEYQKCRDNGSFPPTIHASAWIPAGAMGAYPVWAFLGWLRARRHKPGYCGCGYDLTGNKSGVCPECGTQIDASDAG